MTREHSEEEARARSVKCARCLQPGTAFVVWSSGNVKVVVCLECSKILEGQEKK